MSELEIRMAAAMWRMMADSIAGGVMKGQPDEQYEKGMSEGYASALEMVLRPDSPTHSAG